MADETVQLAKLVDGVLPDKYMPAGVKAVATALDNAKTIDDALMSGIIADETSATAAQLSATIAQDGIRGIDPGLSFVQALRFTTTPISVGSAGDSTMDDDRASGFQLEHMYRFAQKVADAYPSYEIDYYSRFYVKSGTEMVLRTPTRFKIFPIGATHDEFDGTGELVGSAATSGEVWAGTAGSWTRADGYAVCSGSAAVSLTVPTSAGEGGRRISGVAMMSTTTPSAERRVRVWLGADASNRFILSLAVSTGGVCFARVDKVISGTSTVLIGSGATSGWFPAGQSDTEIPFTMEIRSGQVSIYVNGQSTGGAITGTEYTAMGGLTYAGMDGVTAGGTVRVDRLGVSERLTAPNLITWRNGACAGSVLARQTQDAATLWPSPVDVMFLSSSHNYVLATPDEYRSALDTFVTTTRAAGITNAFVAASQPPQFIPANYGGRVAHQRRNAALRGWCSSRGVGYVPVTEAFLALPDSGQSLIDTDGIHDLYGAAVLRAQVMKTWLTSLAT